MHMIALSSTRRAKFMCALMSLWQSYRNVKTHIQTAIYAHTVLTAICAHTHSHTHTYKQTYKHTYTHANIHAHIHAHIQRHIQTHIHAHKQAHIHTLTCSHMQKW